MNIYRLIVLFLALTQFITGAESMDNSIYTSGEIETLPVPVQRFLDYSGIIGTPRIKQVTLEQEGLFKTGRHKSWVPFTATQVFNIEEASFEWKVKMKMAPLVTVKGSDALREGQGSMKIKLFGILPIVNEKGPEMDQGAMTRYLSETIWFPQAFLDDHISWEAIDSLSARATFTIDEKTVNGVFHFNEMGQVTHFTCERYAAEGRDMVLRPWRTPVYEYSEMNGLQIGVKGRAIWEYPDDEFTYVDVHVTNIIYE